MSPQDTLPPYEVQEVSASVDWLTCTSSVMSRRAIMNRLAHERMEWLRGAGMDVVTFASYGYQGFRVGGLQYGRRDSDDIIRLSGEEAGQWWETFGRQASNVSRLDLQVTVTVEPPLTDLARSRYEQIRSGELKLARARSASLIQNLTGGQTLYVGSRVSETMLRMYDKGLQLGEKTAGRTWRYEVEFKDTRAKLEYGRLTNSTSRPIMIGRTVWTAFHARGVTPLWAQDHPDVQIQIGRRITDRNRALRWLASQVAPTIRRLCASGERTDVLEALGLSREDFG